MRQAMLMVAMAPLVVSAADAGKTYWNVGSFTWVKRVPAEPGAALNAQPTQLSEEAIEALLSRVRATVAGKDFPLFARDELRDLLPALSEALALAQPGEDLLLVSSSRRGRIERAEALTARLFVHRGALNLIVHDVRLSFMERWLEEAVQPKFVHGSRTNASAAVLSAPRGTCLRPDWLVLPLIQVTAAAPAAATPPSAAPAEAASGEAQAQRLRTLKRLRDENLISEAEYNEKRDAILKTL
jgi:hypothetical protein